MRLARYIQLHFHGPLETTGDIENDKSLSTTGIHHEASPALSKRCSIYEALRIAFTNSTADLSNFK